MFIIKIKVEHYKNYFIYAYNKDYYKNKELLKYLIKIQNLKFIKINISWHLKFAPF